MPGCITTIALSLRRTLVRSVILFSTIVYNTHSYVPEGHFVGSRTRIRIELTFVGTFDEMYFPNLGINTVRSCGTLIIPEFIFYPSCVPNGTSKKCQHANFHSQNRCTFIYHLSSTWQIPILKFIFNLCLL